MNTPFDSIATADDLQQVAAAMSDPSSVGQMVLRFFINFIVVGLIIHFFYYPKSQRRDYYFTFTLINVSVFFLTFLLGSVKLKIGFALGIFAIFGIIRYRTESVPIREMTYLFVIIAISVINALAVQMDYLTLGVTNVLFILSCWLMESENWLKRVKCKLVKYDKIQLITPDKRDEMIEDLKQRTGLNVTRIEIGSIDFIKDSAIIKIYYVDDEPTINTVDLLRRIPREDE